MQKSPKSTGESTNANVDFVHQLCWHVGLLSCDNWHEKQRHSNKSVALKQINLSDDVGVYVNAHFSIQHKSKSKQDDVEEEQEHEKNLMYVSMGAPQS